MNKTKLTHRFVRGLHLFVFAALLAGLALGVAPVSVARVAPPISPLPVLSASTEGPAELLPFTAGGHVLGFQPDGVYLVGGDHMLKVAFDGARSVAPVANQPPSTDSQAQPLGQVTHPHLWEGISLTYQQVAGGLAKSSYLLEPGAKVDQIRLRYNVPVQVDAGGKLLFGFETGQMSESAPFCLQECTPAGTWGDIYFLTESGGTLYFSFCDRFNDW